MPRSAILAALAVLFCLFTTTASVQAQDLPVELTADDMTYERDLDLVTARGNVEIVQGARTLLADTVSYNQRDDVVTASGNVVLHEPTGDVLFSDYVELRDNFKRGVVRELKARLSNNARLSAKEARREGENITVLERAVYTRCEECPDHPGRAPIWQVKAGKVTRNLDDQIIEYDDAMVEMFGVPVFYTPYFFHPDPTVDRKSGLLAPGLGQSGELGFQYTQPVYFVLDDQSDLTLAPRLTSKEGPVLGGEHRQRFRNGSIETQGSITYVEDEDGNGRKNDDYVFRGHFKSLGNFRVSENFFAGYDVLYTSDDTYMRVYDIQGGTQSRSQAFLNGFNGRSFAGVEGFYFHDFTDGAKEGDIPVVFPLATFRAGDEPALIGGRAEVEMTAAVLQRTGGRDVRRVSVDTGWERQFIDGLGGVTTTGLHFRADGYNVSEAQATDPTASEDDYYVGRIWPQAVVDWRLPMVRKGERVDQTLEPRIQIVSSPAGNNDNDIPNEDSQSFEFSDANLFARNRFAGIDLVDSGSRISYGLTGALLGRSGGSTEFAIGHSVRLNKTSEFGFSTGLEDRFSDVVGRITIAPTSRLNYTFRFRVDPDGPILDRHEHQVDYVDDIFSLDLGYISVPRIVNGVSAGSIEELEFNGSVRLFSDWTFLGGYRGDLKGGPIRMQAGLRYLDECFDFQFGAVRDFTSDRDSEATTSFFIKFKLIGLN